MDKSFLLEDDRIRKEKLWHLEVAAVMGAGRSFSPIYVIFAISAVVIIYPSVSRAATAGWVSTYLIYTIIRTIATSIYHQDAGQEDPARVKDWRKFVFFSAFTHGVILGSLALIALPYLNPARQLVLTAFVLAVTTGAVLYVSAVLPALIVLISTALLPYVVVWYLRADVFEMPVSCFLLAAWVINIFMSLIHHKIGSRLFCLVADNEILVKELEGKNRELEIADRARLQLLAVTSHDLRQPVHALGLMLAHASEDDDVKSIGQHLERLKDVSNLISEMLLELMDLSMLEHEKIEKRTEEICLNALLMQLKTSQNPIAKRKGISIKVFVEEEIWVLADAGLLRRMLLNLLSNAIKYTDVGGVEVECDAQSSHVSIKVRDTGIGIPSDKLNDIFQPYVRLNSKIAEKESLGLGLSIVQRAASIQGFEIRVSSAIGNGSVFELRVPRVSNPREHSQFEIKGSSFLPCGEFLIAVVDDDFFAREALVMLLKHWGYSTISAESLGDLKKALNFQRKPTLIIADNHLSSFEFGSDAIRAIRGQFDDSLIPGIIVSGDANVLIDGLGCVEVAHKPIKPTFLKEIVARMISNSIN
jgi:signal transduction histidine kinase/CheY-like chemotaxis protein